VGWTILQGDARRIPLGDKTVQVCVTSPPFWGLRDYGLPPSVWETEASKYLGGLGHEHEWGEEIPGNTRGGSGPNGKNGYGEGYGRDAVKGQFCPCGAWLGVLGLEPNVAMYVDHIVEIFREVKRVLRSDGTCWINLGSSYASANSGPSPSPSALRDPAYGNDGKGQSNSQVIDSACPDLCDGCSGALKNRRSKPFQQPSLLSADSITHDNEPSDSGSRVVVVAPLSSQESTKPESSPLFQVECSHCANCDVCLSVLRSSLRGGSLCARKRADLSSSDSAQHVAQGLLARSNNTLGIAEIAGASVSRTRGKVSDSSSCHSLTIAPHKVKDLVNVPFYVAEALRADGWWLRSDIIWAKPNPMPESCTDRPTRSHEYLFLLTKSASYYYDAEAASGFTDCCSIDSLLS